ncbi:MAG: hypothetical protein CFH34_00753 [Alphaproteobacteria bacterium MarineAlpha9_Bin4]|nr:hypothetical protein [Pelagibacterales bacterium]PPR26731.1 MAG: hypothetical protein CFH34_00753 [Alphaproteobacteria bacterium MarineAlpha9_Bin4]|tara:strand:- start:1531 stop:2064 length:534 start_codon:yes stop_codon:yes gene_type:complete
MKISLKIKLLIIAFSIFLLSGHAPWGQHEVYRQMHMLLMCSKTDSGAFEFTKKLAKIFDKYLPEAKAKVARARDAERLIDLLSTNQIPLAILSNKFLSDLEERSEVSNFKDLLEHSKTLYTFKNMMLIANRDFSKKHIIVIIDSLYEASQNKNHMVKFFKKTNLVINYDQIVIDKLK